MAWGKSDHEALTAREALGRLTVDDLRPPAALVAADPPKKKAELVPLLAGAMTDPARVRRLYAGLDDPSQKAIRAAAHDPAGRLDHDRLEARFGSEAPFGEPDPDPEPRAYGYGRRANRPTPLRLFFPRFDYLPTDVVPAVRGFVPPPEPFAVPTLDAPPETHALYEHGWHGAGRGRDEWNEAVRVRATAADAEADVRAVLRLVDAGKVRVGGPSDGRVGDRSGVAGLRGRAAVGAGR